MTTQTALSFCLLLSEKFLEGKTYDEVNFDDIDHRIERQNLTVVEEQQVRKYIRERRTSLFTIKLLEKRARPQWIHAALSKMSFVMARRHRAA